VRKDKPSLIADVTLERLLNFLSPAFIIVIWQMLSWLQLIDTRFIPSPLSIATVGWELAESGELMVHLKASLFRLSIGFCIGAVAGVLIGLVMGLSRWIRALLDPIISAVYPIPKIALLPLVMLYFGLGEASKIVIVAVSIVFIVIVNTMAGVITLERNYFDVAKNYRAPWPKFFMRVVLPGALPSIFVGLRLAIGVGLILIVAAEFVAADSGIGFLIWSSFEVFRVENMFVGIIIITILGLVTTIILKELERWILPWREES
jgi:NitT/TauT family transport system permease protein